VLSSQKLQRNKRSSPDLQNQNLPRMSRFNTNKYPLIAIAILVSLVVTSCSKEVTPVEPGGKEEAAFNFYCASSVLNGLSNGAAPIYLNAKDYDPAKRFIPQLDPFPYFSFGLSNAKHESPSLSNNFGSVMYLRHVAGANRFIFTDTTRNKIADTVIDAISHSRNILYLIDQPMPDNSVAQYTVLHVEDDAIGAEGKVKLRVINLSPDAGSLDIVARKRNGDWLRSPLPNELSFKNFSDYILLDTTGIGDNGQIVLNVLSSNQEAILSTGIPAITGASYTLVIEGFRNGTTRRIPTRKRPDDSFEYTSVTIPANLKTSIRRMY
jgi:hypothetical protein